MMGGTRELLAVVADLPITAVVGFGAVMGEIRAIMGQSR